MQDLILLLACVLLLSAGFLAPFIMTLAYVWVDTFIPQAISNGTVSSLPVAFIFGALAVFSYLAGDRRDPPKVDRVMLFMVTMGIWMTCTLLWSRNPDAAYTRWSDVIKVVMFSVFIPFSIRTRVQIEAFVAVYLFSVAAHLMPWGIKTFLTGGGYGLSLGLLRSNSNMLAESSAMSGVGVMIVPLVLAMRKNSLLLPAKRMITNVGAGLMIVLGMVASVGTFARTGLFAIAIMTCSLWLKSKRKISFIVVAAMVGGVMLSVTSDKWTARISTVADYQNEGSAYGRVLVWKWTWNFVQSNPLGGGFLAFIGNRIEIPAENGQPPGLMLSKAYHSIFFSVLGDLGFPGLFLFVGIIVGSLLAARKARRLTIGLPEHVWCGELAQAVQVALLTMIATGLFVDISFFPVVWYLFCMCMCLRQYAVRVSSIANPQGAGRGAVVIDRPIIGIPMPIPSGVGREARRLS